MMIAFIEQPLPDLPRWIAYFLTAEMAVQADTALALEALRRHEDLTDANSIGEMIASDPLMTLKVLSYAATHRSQRVVTDPETVTSALVMMGISPFFAAFGAQPTVEDRLSGWPHALERVMAKLKRAHRAANFALAFAVHLGDPDAPVVHATALLQGFEDMLLWCHAPGLAMQLEQALESNPGLDGGAVQTQVLNIELSHLRQSLMMEWRLPELMRWLDEPRHADHPSVRSVRLGARLARHTGDSWEDAAIADDLTEIAALLNQSVQTTLEFVQTV